MGLGGKIHKHLVNGIMNRLLFQRATRISLRHECNQLKVLISVAVQTGACVCRSKVVRFQLQCIVGVCLCSLLAAENERACRTALSVCVTERPDGFQWHVVLGVCLPLQEPARAQLALINSIIYPSCG